MPRRDRDPQRDLAIKACDTFKLDKVKELIVGQDSVTVRSLTRVMGRESSNTHLRDSRRRLLQMDPERAFKSCGWQPPHPHLYNTKE